VTTDSVAGLSCEAAVEEEDRRNMPRLGLVEMLERELLLLIVAVVAILGE
jgi:hypothetical protein